MKKENESDLFEKIIYAGDFVYLYDPPARKIKKLRAGRPPISGWERVIVETLFSSPFFILGVNVEEAQQRYEFKLNKYDDHYIYLNILSTSYTDKYLFQSAGMVLHKDTFMPRRFWSDAAWRDRIV